MHQFIADQLAGKYADDDRRALFAAFVSLAQSHHEAILVMAGQERLIASAFALFRPMVEVAYRGLFVGLMAKTCAKSCEGRAARETESHSPLLSALQHPK